jgi:hypothetical protein
MRMVGRMAFLPLLALLSSGAPASAAEAQVIGMVAGLFGSASVQRADGAGPAPLALRSEVHEGDTVRTGPGGRLRIALRDDSILSLGADAELKLDHLALSAQPGGRDSLLTLALGYLRAVVGHLQRDSLFQIRSPSMVAAVRGTDWIESYAAGKTELFVAEGRVLATGATNPRSDWALLNSGEGVIFVAGAPHTPVVRWGQEKINRFVDATRVP